MAVDFNELGLSDEEVVEVDWTQEGMFPPKLPHGGAYEFVFKLAEDKPFTSVEKEGKKELQVNYIATTEVDGKEKELRFQRVDTYQAPWLTKRKSLATAYQLLKSLGITVASPVTFAKVSSAFEDASNTGARFTATTKWSGMCVHGNKGDYENAYRFVAYDPKGKQNTYQLEKRADGSLNPFPECPKCGEVVRINVDVDNFRFPKREKAAS